jgi:hypothetical protein
MIAKGIIWDSDQFSAEIDDSDEGDTDVINHALDTRSNPTSEILQSKP